MSTPATCATPFSTSSKDCFKAWDCLITELCDSELVEIGGRELLQLLGKRLKLLPIIGLLLGDWPGLHKLCSCSIGLEQLLVAHLHQLLAATGSDFHF